MKHDDLWSLLAREWRGLKLFFPRYFSYLACAILASGLLLISLVRLGRFFRPDLLASLDSAIADPKGKALIVYLLIITVCICGSLSYITCRTLERIDELLGSDSLSKLAEQVRGFSENVKLALGNSHVKIITYVDLMKIEQGDSCSEIAIITNSLEDDLNDDHFFNIILANIAKLPPKKYRFVVPNVNTNERDGCALLHKLYCKLEQTGRKMDEEQIGKLCEVYLVSHDMFQICAFRDIAIYGAGRTEPKPKGFVELPYVLKTDDPLPRMFMEIDTKVCKQIAKSLDDIIRGDKFARPLSCDAELSRSSGGAEHRGGH
jgi:hypothetical protein